MISLLKYVFTFLTVVAIGVLLWMWGFIGPKPTPESVVSEDEVQCLAAAELADGKYETNDLALVRDEIAKTIRRYSIVNKTPVCDVFEKGLTMVPVGFVRRGTYFGRRRGFIKMEFTDADWNLAMVSARKILSLPESSIGGCATHYIRAPRSYIESKEALDGIRAMTPAPQSDQWKTKFFCPKQ